MKKISIIFFLVISCACADAQQSFLFNLKYLPYHLYQLNVSSDMDMQVNFSGDSTAMDRLRKQGMNSPMAMTSKSDMRIGITTGRLKADNGYSIAIYYADIATKNTVNGAEKNNGANPLLRQTIFGTYDANGKIQIDSISGSQINDEIKSMLTKLIDNMLNQLKFPDKPLKIGETFTQQVPLNLPVAGTNIDATINIVYKLRSIENNLASFDLDESMTMDITTEKNGTSLTLKGTGAGAGSMTYDIKQSFSPLRNANLKVNYTMLMGKLTMAASANISSTTKTIIYTQPDSPPTLKELPTGN